MAEQARGPVDELAHVVASEVNDETLVLFGCTGRELESVAMVVGALMLPVAVMVGLGIGQLAPTLAIGAVVAFVLIGLIARLMQIVKRGRPPGFLSQRLCVWRSAIGLGGSAPFVDLDGPLSTRRTRPVAVIGRHIPWPEGRDG